MTGRLYVIQRQMTYTNIGHHVPAITSPQPAKRRPLDPAAPMLTEPPYYLVSCYYGRWHSRQHVTEETPMTAKKQTVRRLTKADRITIAKRTNRKPTGWVIYDGPSMLDGERIVVIAIVNSSNRKTGDMVQTYIIRADMSPTAAVTLGADVSVCGNCKHRGNHEQGRTCYVNLGQGALAVYNAWLRGLYKKADYSQMEKIGKRRMVRLGTYGDPAAVPQLVILWLVMSAAGITGYTHQWQTQPRLKAFCMASVDSPAEMRAAHDAGWRTFRVSLLTRDSQPIRERYESRCPASTEAGKLTTCDRCKACNGNYTGRRGNIMISAHGGAAVMAAVRKLQTIT